MSTLSAAYETFWDAQLACFDAETIVIDGVTYPCAGGELLKTDELVIGGLIDEPACIVAVKRSLFTSDPALRTTAVYRSKNFKIKGVRSSPDRTLSIFELEPLK